MDNRKDTPANSEISPDFSQSDAEAQPPLPLQEEKQKSFYYTVDDLRNLPDPEWLIQDILAEDGIGAVVGPSKGGKSFLAIDLAFCVARGEPFFGYEVKKAPVLYLAFEGQGRFKYRIFAWEKKHDELAPDNFFIKYDCEFLALKKEGIARFPPSCLTIVDTLSAAAPEIKENSDEMKQIVKKAKEISRITGGAVLIVHHTGKDEEKGSRGHTSFPAGIDTEIFVKRGKKADAPRTWEVTKNRDGEEGLAGSFTLQKIQVDVDKKGRPITSCVVEQCSQGRQPKEDLPHLSPYVEKSFKVLLELCEEAGTNEIPTEQWRNQLLGYGQIYPPNDRAHFAKRRNQLVTNGFIEEKEGITIVLRKL